MMSQLAESVTRQAVSDTNKAFMENNVSKVSIGDLYQQDQNTGRVTFMNPDDPDRPFASRAEAQAWVDAFNKEYDAQWQSYAQNLRNKYMQDTAPAMRLMQFAPRYDAMDETTKAVFDTIIEPYSVKDSTGMLIGFSCDLAAAEEQAVKLATHFGPAATKPPEEPPIEPAATGPALDATTIGTGTSKTNDENPKDLNEAMKILNAKNKEARKNGK